MEPKRLLCFQEKDGAPMGERVRAVGMIFFGNKDLNVGEVYRLKRQRNNPKDIYCLEIIDKFSRPRAVINRNTAVLLSPLLDSKKLENAEW